MKALKISDLHVKTRDGKNILKGVSLTVKPGEIHAIMGPNGSGKSTLAQSVMGHPFFKVTKGKIVLDSKDVTRLSPDKRAKLGLFLAYQNPIEVDGVNFASFMRLATKNLLKEKLTPKEFRNRLEDTANKLKFKDDIFKRNLNEGFSGGEKKRSEIMQLAMLKPKYAFLDEPDSGLDVDGLRHISEVLNSVKEDMGVILITHYQRILKYINPDFVHVLVDGRIVESGDSSLMKQIDEQGFGRYESK